MVHTSDKQHLLDNIETTIMHSLMVESKMQLDLMDVDATWHPNDDLEDSDDDMFDHAVCCHQLRDKTDGMRLTEDSYQNRCDVSYLL
ncbi:hypothetical protein NDA11_000967 [Ustilago hordei]|nr:hypothetical protein NDA11_000967 [Ustilago hordei]